MITKAVIPAAGAGTRLLPATKAQPKEMLPILDTPTIQYVVQEAVDAGIEDVLVVTARDKGAIQGHFARNVELESHLERRRDTKALEVVRDITRMAKLQYMHQSTRAGLGDAIRCARAFVGDDPFAVLLGDIVIDAPTPVIRQLMLAYEKQPGCILAVEEVLAHKTSRYGIVEGTSLSDGRVRVDRLIEKPGRGETTSTMAIAGRYVLTPQVFEALEHATPGRNDEIQLTDAIARLLPETPVIAVPFTGRRYDIGDKYDYLSTILAFALERDEFADVIRSFVASLPDTKDVE